MSSDSEDAGVPSTPTTVAGEMRDAEVQILRGVVERMTERLIQLGVEADELRALMSGQPEGGGGELGWRTPPKATHGQSYAIRCL